MDGPHALTLDERLLELLTDAGLDPTDAARSSYLLIVYVFGSLALEVADVHQPGPLPAESDRIAGRQLPFSATPPEAFPHSAAALTMAAYIATEQYLWGLNGSSTASRRATATRARLQSQVSQSKIAARTVPPR